jgi:aryl carrier-like protein
VVKVLALGSGHAVDRQRSLMDLGMDSLMALELRNRVQSATRLRVALADLLQGPTIEGLAADLLGQVDAGAATGADPVDLAGVAPEPAGSHGSVRLGAGRDIVEF